MDPFKNGTKCQFCDFIAINKIIHDMHMKNLHKIGEDNSLNFVKSAEKSMKSSFKSSKRKSVKSTQENSEKSAEENSVKSTKNDQKSVKLTQNAGKSEENLVKLSEKSTKREKNSMKSTENLVKPIEVNSDDDDEITVVAEFSRNFTENVSQPPKAKKQKMMSYIDMCQEANYELNHIEQELEDAKAINMEYENFITKKDKEFQHLFFNSEILITQAIETMKDKFKKYATEIKSSIEKIQKDTKQKKNCEGLVSKYDNLKNLNEELIKTMLKRCFLLARLDKIGLGESTQPDQKDSSTNKVTAPRTIENKNSVECK